MNNKKNRGSVIAMVALVLVAAVCVGAWFALRPDTHAGAKALTIEVIHSDGSSKAFDIRTDAEYLGDALLEYEEIGVVGEDGPYGLYISQVDGETASDADHTYWAISQDGVALMTGADGQVVSDGEHYELTLTTW